MPKLDRLVQFDERSRNFPVRTLVAEKPPRSYTWACTQYLDQGREGACVGFSWTHELVAKPVPILGLTNQTAQAIYKRAQMLDQWEGESYEGTSVIAGAKAVMEAGYLKEYRWAFGLDDLILAIGYRGPAVLGINWYEGMFDTDSNGFVRVTGGIAGGHAILARGVSVRNRFVLLHNSWGSDWGMNSTAKISFEDLDRLLREQGEACIPTFRTKEAT